MKKTNTYLVKALLISISLALAPIANVFAVQLSGTYTINPSLAASTSNFKDFASAITYMTSTSSRTDGGPANSGTVGVSGPVVFEVAAATYSISSAIIVPAITGSSATNTVTFDGGTGNASTRIITASIASQAIIRMNLSTYVRFYNLTIRNTYSGTCSGIGIIGNNSGMGGSGCQVKYCDVSMPNTGTSTGYGINVTATSTGHGLSMVRAGEIEIDSNTVTGGTHGITVYGNTAKNATYNANIKIRGNTVNNAYTYGVYLYYICNGIDLMYNNINMSTANTGTQYGVYFYYSQNTAGTSSHQLVGNTIRNSSYYGFYIYYCASSTSYPTKIYNNIIAGGFRSITNYGFYMYGASSAISQYEFYHNTINMNFAGTTVYGAYYYNPGSGGSIQVKNNIFACTATGGTNVYPLYFLTNPVGNVVDYNIFYNSVNANLLYRGGAITAATLNAATTGGVNSLNLLPKFKSLTDLHLTDKCNAIQGVDLTASVPLDIDRQTRSITPHIGADEAESLTNDLSIDKVITPVQPIALGYQDVIFRVKNVGANSISSFDYGYKHNLNLPVSTTWSGTLATCDTVTVAFTGINQVNLGTSNTLSVYTSNPNYSNDANPVNDTITSTLIEPLSGAYTIGASGPRNYASFNAAFAALAGGVTGPVTFSVSPGTYTGALSVPSDIPGASSANTISFEGTNAATTIITASVASGATVLINKSKYIIFRNLTITNTNNGSCTGIAILGGGNGAGSGCAIKNCIINLPNVNASMSYAINVTASNNGYGITAMDADSIEIDSNTINGGYYGLAVYGMSSGAKNLGIKVRNNSFNNNYQYGLNIQYVYNAIDILNNSITLSTANSGSQFGMRIYYCQNSSTTEPHRWNSNKINYSSYYGMYLYYNTGTLSAPTQIYNNVINNTKVHGTYIYSPTAHNLEFYHNTTNMQSMDGIYGLYYYNPSGIGMFKNNVFVVSAEAGNCYPAYFNTNPIANDINYNIYYNKANNNLLYRGQDYTALNFKSNTAGGDSSIHINPFISNNDLHSNNNCLRGVNLTAFVPNDINDTSRIAPPSIGAYEYTPTTLDVAIEGLTQPAFPISAGTQDLAVRFRNNGTSTIYSLELAYSLNNGTPVTGTWTGTLAPCDTASFLFTGSKQVTITNGSNRIKVYSSAPNSGVDLNKTNDTLNIKIGPPMIGQYTIGATNSDYTNFTNAISDLKIRGVIGDVELLVKTGSYNESLILTSIPGASDTSSITFTSFANHRDSVILNANDIYAITYANASFINFKNLTIKQLTNGNSGILMTGTLSMDTIYNCNIIVPTDPSGKSFTYNNTDAILNGIVLRKNNIEGGVVGINWNPSYLNSARNCIIDSNLIKGGYYYQISNIYYSSNMKFNNNTVNFCSGGNSNDEVYFGELDSLDFSNNILYTPAYSYTYFYLSGINSVSTNPNKIRNNYFNTQDETAEFTLFVDYSTNIDMYNNAMNLGIGIFYLGYSSSNFRVFNNNINSHNTYNGTIYYQGVTNLKLKNNVISNYGGKYAIEYGYSVPAPLSEDLDYNVYYTSGSNLFYNYNSAISTLNAWRTAYPTFDKNSYSYRPPYANNGRISLTPVITDSASWVLNGRGTYPGFFTNDINNNIRSTTVANGPVDIGAFEITPSATPPLCTATPATPTANTTQVFTFAGDTVAKINWHQYVTPPSSIAVRVYSGTQPPTTATYLPYFYTDISTPSGTYSYDLDLYYKNSWIGNNPNEADLLIIKKNGSNPWELLYYSTVDTATNILSATYQTTFSMFTGTDMYSPLPVKLVTFKADLIKNDAILKWTTAQELNVSHFVVERSLNGKDFIEINKVNAKGNSNEMNNYFSIDKNPFKNTALDYVYYRIKTVDLNAEVQYSNIAKVMRNTSGLTLESKLFPNPVINTTEVVFHATSSNTSIIEVMDITGRVVYTSKHIVKEGTNTIQLDLSKLKDGIHFMNIITDNNAEKIKFIKQSSN